jgi:hypothetical protein
MKRSRRFLAAQFVGLALAASAGVAVAAPAIPTATIGSTTGTGPGGCVRYSKFVGFTLDVGGSGRELTGARVYLDSKLVDVKNWPIGFARARKAVDGQQRRFSSVIRLTGLAGGNHTIKLLGLTTNFLTQRSSSHGAGFDPATGRVTATKTIRKCTAFTG